jgi:hypothetical protein
MRSQPQHTDRIVAAEMIGEGYDLLELHLLQAIQVS